jgi:hypothetical protein
MQDKWLTTADNDSDKRHACLLVKEETQQKQDRQSQSQNQSQSYFTTGGLPPISLS